MKTKQTREVTNPQTKVPSHKVEWFWGAEKQSLPPKLSTKEAVEGKARRGLRLHGTLGRAERQAQH
jgi:hypothetical protein